MILDKKDLAKVMGGAGGAGSPDLPKKQQAFGVNYVPPAEKAAP